MSEGVSRLYIAKKSSNYLGIRTDRQTWQRKQKMKTPYETISLWKERRHEKHSDQVFNANAVIFIVLIGKEQNFTQQGLELGKLSVAKAFNVNISCSELTIIGI